MQSSQLKCAIPSHPHPLEDITIEEDLKFTSEKKTNDPKTWSRDGCQDFTASKSKEVSALSSITAVQSNLQRGRKGRLLDPGIHAV
jgi:hypothetical protein